MDEIVLTERETCLAGSRCRLESPAIQDGPVYHVPGRGYVHDECHVDWAEDACIRAGRQITGTKVLVRYDLTEP